MAANLALVVCYVKVIIAEIISSELDQQIKISSYFKADKCDRLQDDWFIGCGSLEESQHILSKLIEVYRGFSLEINGSKTSVQHILARDKQTWNVELISFYNATKGKLSGSRLRDFLQLALRLQASSISTPIIGFVLSILENVRVVGSDIALMESFLLEATVLAPISQDRICQMLINLNHLTHKISKTRVRDRYVNLIENNLQNGHTFEALWQIYTLRGLSISFSSRKITALVEKIEGSAIPLVLLDMDSKGLVRSRLPIDIWEGRLTHERIVYDWSWLLGYEGIRNGWLKDKSGIMSGKFLKPLIQRNIRFYDASKNVESLGRRHRRRSNSVFASLRASAKFMEALRQNKTFNAFEFFEY